MFCLYPQVLTFAMLFCAGRFDDGAHFRLNVPSDTELTPLARGQGILNICSLYVGVRNDLELVGNYFVYQ